MENSGPRSAPWTAISTLAASLTALADTVNQVNAGVRTRLQLDHESDVQAPALPANQVLDHQAEAEPVASNGKRSRSKTAATTD